MPSDEAWSWRVVLVRPRNPLNIGAAARAMANFGLRDLVVVKPYPPVWQETRSAVGAEEIVKSAHAAQELDEALGDAALVVGTTSGSRRNLDRDLVPLHELKNWLRRRTRHGAQLVEVADVASGIVALCIAQLVGSPVAGLLLLR